MQSPDERKIRFIPQENNPYENSIIPIRYGIGFKYDSDIIKDKVVVDAGCAFGAGAEYLLQNGQPKTIIGVDVNECPTSDTIVYKQSLLWETDIDTESVDVVYFIETIEHNDFEERDLIIKEFNRILKVGGLVVVTTPRKRSYNPFPSGSHFIEYEYEEVIDVFNKLGFEFVWGNPEIGVDSMALIFKKIEVN